MGSKGWSAVSTKPVHAVTGEGVDISVRRYDPDPIIAGICNKDISRCIDCNSRWVTQLCRSCGTPIAAKTPVTGPGYCHDEAGRIDFADPLIRGVANKDITCLIHCDC